MLEVLRIENGPLNENCYVVSSSSGDAVVIDPGGGFDRIASHVTANDLRVRAVLNTHAHYDHLAAVAPVVEAYGVPFHLHPDDEGLLRRANFYGALFLGQEIIRIPKLDVSLADATTLSFGSVDVAVLHTPGHTPGGVCFEAGGELFTGDTVLSGYLGRTDLPGGSRGAMEASVALLAERYPPETGLRPGHGEPAALGDSTSLAALPELRL